MSALNDWPAPNGWLYGFIDTSVPGYRKIAHDTPSDPVTNITLDDGYYSFPAYIDELNTQLAAVSGTATTDSIGRVTVSVADSILGWTDRLGWVIGMDVTPGEAEPATGVQSTWTSDRPPPAAIPLMSVSWSRIDRAVETNIAVDRHRRGHGYLFGDADLMRFRLLLHVQALRSFRAGWCLAGQVIISTKNPADFSTDALWSPSNTDGYVQGYVVGVEKGKWIDSTQTLWQTDLIVSKA